MGDYRGFREGRRRAPLAAALCAAWLWAAPAFPADGVPPRPAKPPSGEDVVGDDEQHAPAKRVDPQAAPEETEEEPAGDAGKTDGEKRREERRARRKARREARGKDKSASGLTTEKDEAPGVFSGTLKKARNEGDAFTRPLKTLETSATDGLPASSAGLTGTPALSATERGSAGRTASVESGGAGGGVLPSAAAPGEGPAQKAALPFQATPSRDPANPAGVADLVLASRSGFAPVFQAAGLKLGEDGRSLVRIADGRPATEAELQKVRQEILAAPAAMAKRPDYFTVLPRAHYEELGRDLRERPELADKSLKHIEKTPDGRDFVYSASCDRMSGDCNKSVGKSSYRKGEPVAPEDLEKVWEDLQDSLDADEAAESGGTPARFSRPLSGPGAGLLARARRSAGSLVDGLLDVAGLLTGSRPAEGEAAGPAPLGASRAASGPGGKAAGAENSGPAAPEGPRSLAETFRSPERKFLLILLGVIVALGLLWRLRD